MTISGGIDYGAYKMYSVMLGDRVVLLQLFSVLTVRVLIFRY